FAMSSNNASSTVTYTSVSFNSNGPSSWGIPLESNDEIPDMDTRRSPNKGRHIHCHLPIQTEDQPYAEDASLTAKSPGYIADSDLMEDDIDADSIDYPDEPGTDDEDEDPKEDPSEEHEPENEDAKEDESFEDSDETEPFEENETAATPPPRLP
ncbi:hypothetical protein Tco_1489771, partial [Tanacetum coccineum]